MMKLNKMIKTDKLSPAKEIWKPVVDRERYEVSTHGRVKNSETGKILSDNHLRSGYKSVCLSKSENDVGDQISFKIHRLVAKAFVKNDDPTTKTNVDHIDGDKLNNYASNLEWVSGKENTRRGFITGKNKVTKRAVNQLDLEGNIINTFDSLQDARIQTGLSDASIVAVCRGRRRTYGGFKWEYADINPNDGEIDLTGFVDIDGF
ncbi:MAG: hypothetical protein EBQ92_00685, partial [Proteobacteria bacterium]|nr:hypothetical protein [Pseudomonadota bacterium]